jgi:hypothetical protein
MLYVMLQEKRRIDIPSRRFSTRGQRTIFSFFPYFLVSYLFLKLKNVCNLRPFKFFKIHRNKKIIKIYRLPLWSSGQCSWLHNGDVLCFLWGTNWIYICYVEERRPLLWSSGQSSWLQIRRSGFDSRHYQKNSGRSGTGTIQPREYNWGATWSKRSGPCLEIWEYGRIDPSRWPRGTLYPQKLALTSQISDGRSVGVVRSRTQTMEFF